MSAGRSKAALTLCAAAVSSLLLAQCVPKAKQPPVAPKPLIENLLAAAPEKKLPVAEPLEDSWSKGKCVVADGTLRLAIDGGVDHIQLPSNVDWKYLFCSEKYVVLVSESNVFVNTIESLINAIISDSEFVVWRMLGLNLQVEGEVRIGKVKGAYFDKESSIIAVLGEEKGRVFLLDAYPYLMDVEYKSELDGKPLYSMKSGYLVVSEEGAAGYIFCDPRNGEEYWQDTGQPITSLELVSAGNGCAVVKANDVAIEHYGGAKCSESLPK